MEQKKMKMEIACVINVRGMTRRKSSTAASATESATARLASKHGTHFCQRMMLLWSALSAMETVTARVACGPMDHRRRKWNGMKR
jgi:hypothetical protein